MVHHPVCVVKSSQFELHHPVLLSIHNLSYILPVLLSLNNLSYSILSVLLNLHNLSYIILSVLLSLRNLSYILPVLLLTDRLTGGDLRWPFRTIIKISFLLVTFCPSLLAVIVVSGTIHCIEMT